MKQILSRIVRGEILSRQETCQIIHDIVDQRYNDVQVSALLTGLVMRGIKVDELVAMLQKLMK